MYYLLQLHSKASGEQMRYNHMTKQVKYTNLNVMAQDKFKYPTIKLFSSLSYVESLSIAHKTGLKSLTKENLYLYKHTLT